jgi:hypothetical protein
MTLAYVGVGIGSGILGIGSRQFPSVSCLPQCFPRRRSINVNHKMSSRGTYPILLWLVASVVISCIESLKVLLLHRYLGTYLYIFVRYPSENRSRHEVEHLTHRKSNATASSSTSPQVARATTYL